MSEINVDWINIFVLAVSAAFSQC